jgi:CubicO group peptidase (beta-lactamase class C family)
MKRAIALFSLCGLLALCGDILIAGQAQPSPQPANPGLEARHSLLSADEILRRALEARGGQAALERIQSFRVKGTAVFIGGGQGDYEFLAARPNRYRGVIDAGGGDRYEFIFNGQSAWEILPGSAPETKVGERLRESQDGGAFFAACDDPRTYRSVRYAGLSSLEGMECHELKILTQSGLEQTHYYSASNYLLAGTLERITTVTGPSWCLTRFLDYRKFDGFKFPTRLRCRTEESEWAIRLSAVQANRVDGSAFNAPAVSAGKEPPPADLSDAEIKTLLRDCIEGDRLGVGLVVGLVDPQGCRVISCGKLDNGNSPDANGDTLFEIGSITKVFTRLLLYDMIARGEMNIDDPVQKYLPASVHMPTRHGQQITLWHLISHTSGLPRDMGGPTTAERLYAFLAGHKLRRDPGEQVEYSNLGVALLGHAIALKAGQDYETLVRERICRPLKMDSTAITLTPELQARRATGHAPAGQPADFIGLQGLPGAGALFSTANDLLKLASAKLGLAPCPLAAVVKRAGGHDGGTFGFSTSLNFDVQRRRALVILSNCRDDGLIEHLRPLLKNQSPRPPQTASINTGIFDQYVGQYYAKGDRVRTVRREGDRLLLQEWGRASCELFPLSETNFYNRMFDCRATFVRDGHTSPARELLAGGWRGTRLSGRILPPSASQLAEKDCPRSDGSDLQGVWQATLRPWYWPFFSLHLKVRVAEPSPGAFRAEGDSPDQGVKGEPLGLVYNPPNVEVFPLSDDGFFQGKLNPAHTRVTGYWNQDGHSLHATFRRVPPAPALPAAP